MIPNHQEIDPLISKFLFDYARFAIDKNDFELFKNTINDTCLLNVYNPRFFQNQIYGGLHKEIHPPLFYYNHEVFEKIINEITCFEFLINYWTIRDFNSVTALIGAYELYEKNLEKYIFSITKSEKIIQELAKMYGTDHDGILKMVETTINSINPGSDSDFLNVRKQLDLLFISLKLHFAFYRIGAFIIFTGKQKQLNTAQYLKELWDHTHPDDADGFSINETPVLFDPLWLTYLHFYGGQNIEHWTKATFSFSLGFEDFHGAESYLYQYYLLTITRCLQRGNCSLSLPTAEGMDTLKAKEPYKFKEFYEFTELFKRESDILLPYCEELIKDAPRWNLLFNNQAESALTKTKEWIEQNKTECERKNSELKRRMTADSEKIEYYSQMVLEEYHKTSIIEKLAIIKRTDEETANKIKFIHIYQNIGNLDKRWFFKDDYSHPDQIFTEFGRSISRGEKVHILETIKKEDSIEIFTLKEVHPSAIFNKIKEVTYQLKNSGFNPSVIFLPLDLKTKFSMESRDFSDTLKIDNAISLNIVHSHNQWAFEEIVILDKSAGIWTYKPVKNTDNRVSVEITPNENDELSMKIFVKTTVNYSIIQPNAVRILKFDLSITPST